VMYSIIWQEPQSYLNPFPPEVRYVFVTATPAAAVAQPTPTFPAAATPLPLFPFILRDGAALYIANSNGQGCAWSSIAGSITDAAGSALNGYRVRVTAASFDETVFSGAALTFGPGGYELPLGSAPQPGDYVVQLFSPQGAPLSDAVAVSTRADCAANVVLVNFVESR
ncbi:MAG: hypothetical protein MUE40_21760, partial [Anaerolineae bacterium]|nr:hypothetical protein [Anaerolineae bacterium]